MLRQNIPIYELLEFEKNSKEKFVKTDRKFGTRCFLFILSFGDFQIGNNFTQCVRILAFLVKNCL